VKKVSPVETGWRRHQIQYRSEVAKSVKQLHSGSLHRSQEFTLASHQIAHDSRS